jgi:RNA polymerase sigma-70 factor (sigma-E family)
VTFEEFSRRQLPPLLRFAKVLCGDRGLAEDVVQEVLARAYDRWDRISILDQPEIYVRRMIVNEFLSWRRKWARVIPFANVPEAEAAPDVSELVTDRDALVAELGKLPRRQRAVIVLRFYGELTDAEIATELGCSTGTVRSHASRGLATLRVEVNPLPSLAKES